MPADPTLAAEIEATRRRLMRRDFSSQYEKQALMQQLVALEGKRLEAGNVDRATAETADRTRREREQRVNELSAQLRSAKPEERAAARKTLDEMAAAERAGEQSNT